MRTHIKGVISFAVLCAVLSPTTADVEITFSGYLLPMTYYRGIQQDINRQVLIVANDTNTWNTFLNSVPSLQGPVPAFEQEAETGLILTTKAEPCVSTPKVTAVSHQIWRDVHPNVENIEILVLEEKTVLEEGEVCDHNEPVYVSHLITIEKTALPVSLDIRREAHE